MRRAKKKPKPKPKCCVCGPEPEAPCFLKCCGDNKVGSLDSSTTTLCSSFTLRVRAGRVEEPAPGLRGGLQSYRSREFASRPYACEVQL